jgi:hypothetical protein
MPALPPIPGCFELRFVMSDGANTNEQCRSYWSYNQSLSATDLTTIVGHAFTLFGTQFAPLCGTWWTLEQVIGTDLASNTGAQETASGSTPGTSAGTGKLSSGTAFVLSFEGATRYRGGHSRIYIPGYTNTEVADANSWTIPTATNTVNAWSAFRNALIAAIPTAVGVVAQVIAHRYGASGSAPVEAGSGSKPRSVPLTHPFTEPVVALRGNLSIGAQRRRNLYVA